MVERGPGISLMTIGMVVAGIGCLLAGLLAIGFGIPINEFGLGNTLILAGSVAACSGLIILSLWVAVRELKSTVRQLGSGPALDIKRDTSQLAALPRPAGAEGGVRASDVGPMAGEPADARRSSPPSAPPSASWFDEAAARDRPRPEAQLPQPPEASPRQRRNLMFSSTLRQERERGQGRAGDTAAAEPRQMVAAPTADADFPPAGPEDTWLKAEQTWPLEAPQRRRVGNPPKSNEQGATRQPPAIESDSRVAVIRSGVVEGMAYSLYSDGSIEAEMPEGTMRFASVDELRAHLDRRH
jgi:hypothetical protein